MMMTMTRRRDWKIQEKDRCRRRRICPPQAIVMILFFFSMVSGFTRIVLVSADNIHHDSHNNNMMNTVDDVMTTTTTTARTSTSPTTREDSTEDDAEPPPQQHQKLQDENDTLPPFTTNQGKEGGRDLDPFFVVSTVDGSIGVLRALDGSLVSGFRSGSPLVTPSEVLSGGRRIVPGLDGRLYVSLEEQQGLLQPLEITVIDVLQTPVKTCTNGGVKKNCGIVTATKSTSLFAIEAKTGLLVWRQSKNGTTTIEMTNHDNANDKPQEITSTVLLQREDVLIQQLSTDSGQSVWNATLGTVQALEFGGEGRRRGHPEGSTLPSRSRSSSSDDEEEDEDDISRGNGGAYLPSGRRSSSLDESRQVSTRDYYTKNQGDGSFELPSVIFGSDGTTLMAVKESKTTTSSGGGIGVHVLWTREFPTVVASVFGLQDRTWKPLTVLDLPPMSTTAGTDGSSRSSSSSSSEQYHDDDQFIRSDLDSNSHSLTLYRPSMLQQFFSSWSRRSMSLLDQLAGDWFWATGQHRHPHGSKWQQQQQQQQHRHEFHRHSWPTLDQSLNQFVVPRKHTMSLLLPHEEDIIWIPQPQLALPAPRLSPSSQSSSSQLLSPSSDGIYLTWPWLIGICVTAVTVTGIIFRYIYLQRKNQWFELVQQMAKLGLLANENNEYPKERQQQQQQIHGEGPPTSADRSNSPDREGTPLKRSRSLPDVTASMTTTMMNGESGLLEGNHHNNNDNNSNTNNAIVRRLRSESLQISHNADGRLVYDKLYLLGGVKQESDTSSTVANTSSPILPPSKSQAQQKQQQQQTQGVDFLVDGIPLIRYNRYDSEFSEVIALGKGGFGTVFRCKNVLDGREYAIKKVFLKYKENLPLEEFRQRLQRTLREVKSLALLDHPNIVRYYTAWLELQQKKPDGTFLGQSESSQAMADSDYYLFSPTVDNTRDPTKSARFPSPMTDGKSPNHFTNGSRKIDNPMIGWNALEETTTPPCGNVSVDPFIAGVPAALDDYGFTFDRSDENPDTFHNYGESTVSEMDTNNKQTKDGIKGVSPDDKGKSLGFFPHGPTIHRYSHGYSSSVEAESSIECSVSHTENASSQSGRRAGITDSSTEGPNHDSPPTSMSPAMVRHILYIQMQFCSQKTLADFLGNADVRQGSERSGTVDIPYALSLFLQIVQGVEHVHSQGLIHRDLKPNNCFMDDSGVVKVGDFGLSRESATDNREELETVDELEMDDDDDIMESIKKDAGNNNFREITAGVGTRSYASPEQMKGSDYDSSTDIYSLGIMLFELCYPMYTGMERTIVFSQLRNHVFPSGWMDGVKPAFPTLHSLLESMLSSRPADRPSATIVARNIQGILEGFTISSIDKHHHESAILLRVEAKPRDDVLRHTIDLVKEAALPDTIEIIQYGLRGGTTKAVMEFAISSVDCQDRVALGHLLVSKLGGCDEVLLIRQVSGTKYTTYNS